MTLASLPLQALVVGKLLLLKKLLLEGGDKMMGGEDEDEQEQIVLERSARLNLDPGRGD